MTLRVYDLRTEYMTDPAGIDALRPRLGWLLASDGRGAVQSACRVLVASDSALLADGLADVWDSGKKASEFPRGIVYDGPRLQSGRRYAWMAKAWDQHGGESPWSEPAAWSMGLLSRGDWTGAWIGLKSGHKPTHAEPKPAVYLRGAFRSSGRIRRAVVHCAVLGAYELYVNGRRVADDTLLPEWTDYGVRLHAQSFDVAAALTNGDNALALLLGHGWYSGYIGMFGYQRYGQDPRALVQLNIEYEDGSRQFVVSGTDWKASFGALRATDFQMGETYDARLEKAGWTGAGFDDGEWPAAQRFYDYKGRLCGTVMPPVRAVMTIPPVSVTRKDAGRYIVDMGQNMVGRLRLAFQGSAGDVITVRHGEMLDSEGELYTENLRLARQTDTFILKGEELERFEPHFTLHGFRYAEISGCDDERGGGVPGVTGVVYSTALKTTGVMETSDPLLNRLLRNIEWTQRGNFVSVPTDCPQRDERLGWSGDAQVFFRTASYFMDAAAFFAKWQTDLTDAQRPTGAFTDFAPFIAGGKTEHGGDMTYDHTASAGWGDAGVLIPWMMYQVYGDTAIIERHYDAMARWIAFLGDLHPGHLREDLPQFGDWLSLAEAHGPSGYPNTAQHSTTPYDVFGTAYYAHSVDLLSRMAAIVGLPEDAARYGRLFGEIKAAFNAAFVDERGRIKGDTQAAYALALAMKLLPEEKRANAAQRIVELLEANGWHMTTGIHGTKYLLSELVEAGREDAAYRLLRQQEYPSWLYSVLQGATTIWERWDGWTEERGFQRPGMNSFNQYALGAVGEWLFRYAGGIDLDPGQPGFRHIRIQPRVGGGLDFVRCRYDSIAGPIVCNWRLDEGVLTLEAGIPAGSTASVRVPRSAGQRVTESGVDAAAAPGVTAAEETESALLLTVGSGDYRFVVA